MMVKSDKMMGKSEKNRTRERSEHLELTRVVRLVKSIGFSTNPVEISVKIQYKQYKRA